MQVSVETALRRGRLLLKVIPMAILFLGIVLSMALSSARLIAPWGIAAGLLLSGIASWLWWSFAVTRWRIWSLKHVRNIHELMDYAEQDKLLWRRGRWPQRTEIKTQAQKELLAQLEAKRAAPDVIRDDQGIPLETVVHYSRAQTGFTVIIGSLLICLCLYFLREPKLEKWWLYALVGGLGIWMIFNGARKFFDRRPQLILNDRGIILLGEGYFPWTDIDTAEVVTEGTGKNSRTLLKFRSANASYALNIGELSISKTALRQAIRIHRFRSENPGHLPNSA